MTHLFGYLRGFSPTLNLGVKCGAVHIRQGGFMLILTRSIGTAIIIGDHIVLKVIGIKGERVRFGIEAPKETLVQRAETKKHEPTPR